MTAGRDRVAPSLGGQRALLSGWGRTAPTAAELVRPSDTHELVSLLKEAAGSGAGVVPRGLGRAYGDAAQCAGGTVVDTSGLQGVIAADLDDGWVRAGAGTSLDQLMRALVPRGWFVPVTPGTRQVTLGGAVAADIHGKNHHRDGSFCSHVSRLTLVTPSGMEEVAPEGAAAERELFWATAGGMGLTGVVADATVRLTPVESAYMVVDTERAVDLDAVMAALAGTDRRRRYSVAWVDCLSTGRGLGRGVVTSGDHATVADLPLRLRPVASAFEPSVRLEVPVTAPSGLLNPLTVSAFNELWFRKAPKQRVGEIQHMATFFHPLDGVGGWNKLYGRRGFVQYQFVVPPSGAETVRGVLERLTGARVASFLAVLKRFGPADPGPLSFPIAGWTLALDLPVGPAGLGELLDRIDDDVAEAGGRVYLAKDARLRPELLSVMYPRLEEWRAVRDRVDPEQVLCSDLARRLGLVGGRQDRRHEPRPLRHERPREAGR
jgi:decaprenylphospho-beta-D-ribofuranose 2-oxidase